MASGKTLAGSVRDFLVRDHARVLGLLDLVLDESTEVGGPTARDRWHRFEAALLGHMAVEERLLIRPFGREHRREAEALRAEHAALRERLSAPGQDGAPGGSFVRGFAAALWDHAEREDRLLYLWADHLGGEMESKLVAELSRPAR